MHTESASRFPASHDAAAAIPAPNPAPVSAVAGPSALLRAAAIALVLLLALATLTGTADAARTHTVKRGETISSIARTQKVVGGVPALARANRLSTRSRLAIGQRLVLPAAVRAVGSTPPPAPKPAPKRAPKPAAKPAPAPKTAAVWDRLARCESGGNWRINTGNGYYGGLQFSKRSWRWVGGRGLPHQASKGEQIKRAQLLKKRQGWGAWPACSRKLGLR